MPSTLENTETYAVHTNFSVYAKFGATDGAIAETIPVSAIRSTFQMNGLPSAQIIIPTGKPVNDSSVDAIQYSTLLEGKLNQFREIEIWMKAVGDFAPGVAWPQDEFCIFRGIITGTSLTRTTSAISLVVQATHWLLDLDGSSALSSDVVTTAPIAIRLPATTLNLGSSAIDPDDPLLKLIPKDFWTEGIKPKFIEICNGGSIMTTVECGPSEFSDLGKAKNDIALNRLEVKNAGAFDVADKIDVPIVKMVDSVSVAVAGAIAQSAARHIFNGTLGTSTLWDKLQEVCQLFQVSIIPNVDSATIAHVSPCLSGDDPPRHVTIKASEYHSFSPSETVFRTWRGVAMFGQFHSPDGASDDTIAVDYRFLPVSGCYLAERDGNLPSTFQDRAKFGAMQFIPAPDWLMDSSLEGAFRARQTLSGMNNTMRDVEEGAEAEIEGAAPTQTDDTRDPSTFKSLGNAYAQWWYWIHQFLPRTGELSGKLRFDIAPGSIVRIEDIDGKLYETEANKGYLYAMVTSVSYYIDALNGSAATSFTFSHLRRDSEKLYGLSGHPLYESGEGQRWVGTVLQNLNMTSGTSAGIDTFVPQVGSHEVA